MEEGDMEISNNGEAFTGSSSSSSWSDLPPELLSQISAYLQNSYVDILRFRAVCPSWRSSVSIPSIGTQKIRPLLSPNLPIKIPTDPFPHMGNHSFYLTATTTFLLQPVNGGPFGYSSSLLTVDEFNRGKLAFREPLSGLYRSTWAKKSCPMSLNLLGFRVLVVSEDFSVRHLSVRRNASENVGTEVLEPTPFGNESSAKAVVLSNPFGHALVLYQGGVVGVLGLEPCIEWKVMPDPGALRYDDIVKVASKNLVFGVCNSGAAHLITFNHGTCSIDQVAVTSPIVGGSLRRKRLVADSSNDILFLVETRCQGPSIAFNVYKLDIKLQNWEERLQKWERVTNLDDRVLFVDVDFSFCTAAQDFDGLAKYKHLCNHGNCIIFTKGSFWRSEFDSEQKCLFGGPGTHMNIGMFCLEDDHAIGLIEPGMREKWKPTPMSPSHHRHGRTFHRSCYARLADAYKPPPSTFFDSEQSAILGAPLFLPLSWVTTATTKFDPFYLRICPSKSRHTLSCPGHAQVEAPFTSSQLPPSSSILPPSMAAHWRILPLCLPLRS